MAIPAPGRLVDVGGRRLHAVARGSGEPVVVLEAGIAATSLSWALVQPGVAEFSTALAYDRAGFGWSDGARGHRTAADSVDDLARLLDGLSAQAPVVLVGHSFGGLIARLFQQKFPERVAGMVLVDPVVRDEWRSPVEHRRQMLRRGAMLSRRGAMLARLGVVGFALNRLVKGGQSGVPKAMARLSAGRAASVTDRLAGEVRKMPRELWPAVAQHWSNAESFRTMARNLENLPESAGLVDEAAGLGELPLVVLSAGNPAPEHAREAGRSGRGRHVAVAEAGHWLQLDAPEAVVAAVREVVREVRGR